jgi:FKBP-type peptidyl-prolyl cis-trans isomerase
MKPVLGLAITGSLAICTSFLISAPVHAQQPAGGRAQPGAEALPPSKAAAPVAGLTSDKQKASYGIGFRIGGDMRAGQLSQDDIDVQALVRGLSDAIAKKKPALTEEDLQQAMTNFHAQLTARMQDKAKVLGDKNKKEGEAFLAANKSKDGVITLPSGLQYKVIKSGTGPTPGPTDVVQAHYKGTLLDGTVFDSSFDRGKPETFPVSGVIPGWTEALQLMKVGDKWQLFIPAALGYKETGSGADIGPNAVLVFDVELLDVNKGDSGGASMMLPPGK